MPGLPGSETDVPVIHQTTSCCRLDVKRDAAALWRAVLAGDREGAFAIIGNTSCAECLAMQAVVAGLFAAVPGTRLGEAGRITVPAAERARLDRALRGLLGAVRDRGEVSRGR